MNHFPPHPFIEMEINIIIWPDKENVSIVHSQLNQTNFRQTPTTEHKRTRRKMRVKKFSISIIENGAD